MNSDKTNIIYNAKDIEQYFSGKMTPAQMHALEKAALDDPFLAEAMEGYETYKGKEWNTTLVSLHQHFAPEKPIAKLIPLNKSTGKWWKTAAAILVIGCGTALTYFLTKEKTTETPIPQIASTTVPNKDVATEKTIQKENKTVTPLTSKTNVKPGTQPATQTVVADKEQVVKVKETKQPDSVSSNNTGKFFKDDIAKNVEPVTTTAPEKKQDNYAGVQPAAPINDYKTIPSLEDAKSRAEAINSIAKVSTEEKKKVSQNEAYFKSQILNRSFIAQVVGPDNSPLPFSNISVKSENFGTYTDVKGNVRLVSADTIINVEVRSVGYVSRSITLHSNQSQNKIVLAEDEVVVKGRTVNRSKDVSTNSALRIPRLVKDSANNVEPSDGWDNYNTYIANNIELPNDILQNNIHGEIGITFDVKSNGAITNIKVDQSNCNNCEGLARQLIEQGPQWKLKKGKKASARLKVQF